MPARRNGIESQAAPPLQGEEFDLKDVLRVLYRRLGTIIGTVLVLTGGAWLLALNLTPLYTAVSTVVVEPRDTLIINFDDLRHRQDMPKDTEMMNTHAKILTSNYFIRQVLESLDLLNNPEFNLSFRDENALDNITDTLVAGDFNAFIAGTLSWARMHLVAIGLAGQPSSSMPDQAIQGKAGEHQKQLQLGPVAVAASRGQGEGKAQQADHGGRLTTGKANGYRPDQVTEDERPTGVDRAPAMGRFRLPEQFDVDDGEFDAGGDGRGMGAVTQPWTVQINPRDPGIVVFEANDPPNPESIDPQVSEVVARSAEFVPHHRVEAGPIPHDGEGGASEWRPAISSQEEERGSPAVLEDGAREALMAAATEIFLEQLEVGPSGESYAISVAFTSVDPETAAQITNTMAELYVEHQLEAKQTATNGALDWLAGRLNELRAQLVAAQKAAEAYREQNELLASGRGLEFSDQELAALSQELIGARAERVASEAKLRRIQELRNSGQSLDAVPEIMVSPVIANLRQREMDLLREEAQLREEYGPRHPNMIQLEADKDKLSARIDAEVQHVIGAIAHEITTIRAREETLQAKLEEAKAGSIQNNRAEIQLHLLEREAESTRRLYETFLDRFKQLTEQRELLEPGVRVISEAAAPTEPSFPQVKLMIGAGFMGSLMFATLLAFVVDRLDGGLRTGRQAEAVLNIAHIGFIPRIGAAVRGRGPHLYLVKQPTSAYAEAIRAVQTALYFSNVDRPPQVVLVTSSVPGEGKTTLALSLAALLGASRYRTLVMDLDLRAPALARRLRKVGGGDLIDYMKERKKLEEILHEVDGVDNLDMVASRRLAGSPTDLLTSRRMASLMAELRARYQYIILDSPPLLGMSDSRFAAHLADAVVFVVRWSKTGEEVAQKALAILRDSGTPVAGAVLTQVNVRRHKKYSPADVAHYYGRYKKYYVN